VLDIREVNTISLSADRKSVTIGGGVQTGPLVDYLDERGLVTTCTLAGIVGHVGWAFSGGFGPFANSFGLGVDQILSAKVITASGEIAEAGEGSELLWGVKGAGGAFGVVSEVRLKVYELPKMLGGSIMFKFEEARQVVAGYLEMLEKEGRPGALTIGFHFSKRMGKPVFMAAFSWASTDFEKGRKWLAKVKGLGTEMMDMVTESKSSLGQVLRKGC
jgi:FAD/FMN-containing dehydrogenase